MIIYELSEKDVGVIQELLSHAEGRPVRISMESGLKVKVGGGIWTAPMGKKEYA
jgi:hypothetical protein